MGPTKPGAFNHLIYYECFGKNRTEIKEELRMAGLMVPESQNLGKTQPAQA